jgi:hypothetical protein
MDRSSTTRFPRAQPLPRAPVCTITLACSSGCRAHRSFAAPCPFKCVGLHGLEHVFWSKFGSCTTHPSSTFHAHNHFAGHLCALEHCPVPVVAQLAACLSRPAPSNVWGCMCFFVCMGACWVMDCSSTKHFPRAQPLFRAPVCTRALPCTIGGPAHCLFVAPRPFKCVDLQGVRHVHGGMLGHGSLTQHALPTRTNTS